ncbi:hypothetical protein [uncultured Pelagimonas sp.]|uniref:hypothetical protein n=1 Tax=uncultured Pelagimonas sp. TaxID=1618102 RepID=UPI002609D947|nr:hypothetical protein [uncultured Pelagimonas sp.]
MAIFDLEKDDLLRLSDTQLEELIARLSEAEVAMQGHSPARVSWSGSINAPDEGIDIHVEVPAPNLDTGFLARPDTVLQAKKHSMPKSEISSEMTAGGKLSPTISQQATKGGSYIIVSLADDCSPPMKKDRLKAMRDAIDHDPQKSNLHLDFFDRSKLLQWLRQHPSVLLWVKSKLGQGYSGWQPYAAWSNPPRDADDTLISASGVVVTLPSRKGEKLKIDDAIGPMRELIRSTNKAVRITGLSGVGKTRIVQALFDETIGTLPLDRTIAVYVDTGAEPDPSATAMLDRLLAEGRRAVMVLDNCPSELHSALAGKVSASKTDVALVTVEYDIRDDKPQTTEVIHIEADGPDVAEQLLIRRFPGIGQTNARKIAEFADGNARVSLAVAERVEEGESLAQLSDSQLFDRLFEQRNQPDENLREHAEILSLVYSFSITKPEVGMDELDVLGSVSGILRSQLFRSHKKLLDRHIVQKRSHWRAILPHAIANRLAQSALDSIPIETLRETFEAPGCERLLMSFAHRLGLMHDHDVAKEIVEAWLQPNGLLGQISALNDTGARMLDYIGPVAPDALLDRIEAEINGANFDGMELGHNPRRTTILGLLQSMAYEAVAFDRCVRLLVRVADFEDESNNYDAVRDKVVRFFQAYLSGTHASLEQRLQLMQECIQSDNPKRQALGFRMLSAALDGPPWMGSGMNEFGARPRDFGFRPNHDQLVAWRSAFLDVAVQLGTTDNIDLSNPARLALANEFRGMWHQEAMRDRLVDAARVLHTHEPWGEGWLAIRSTIYFDYTKRKPDEDPEPLPDILAALQADLEPRDLLPTIMTYVLSKGADYWSLDSDFDNDDPKKYHEAEQRLQAKAKKLGEDFAASGQELAALGPNLFSNDWMPYRGSFGQGLAKGAHDQDSTWHELVAQLEKRSDPSFNYSVHAGFIEEIASSDPASAQKLLDQCANHHLLCRTLVGLHPSHGFTEIDLDRCLAALDKPEVPGWMYGAMLWRDEYAALPHDRIVGLAERILAKPHGDDVVLEGLSMKLHGKDGAEDTLGLDLRHIGLDAATKRILRDQNDPGGSTDHSMENVIDSALLFEGNEDKKHAWLNTIFDLVDARYGSFHGFNKSIQTTAARMPDAFLDRAFAGDEEARQRRRFFIESGGMDRLPLTEINVDRLISWCERQDDSGVWAMVGASINLWETDQKKKLVALSEDAMKFLGSAPDARAVLSSYASRLEPRSGSSGNQADSMQPRANAIGALANRENTTIAKAAEAVFVEANRRIEDIRRREQRRTEEREQTFE